MKRKKTKDTITISINKQMNDILEEIFSNKSEYIEWLIYQDLKKFLPEDKTKNILL
jgi:hypothetical protein